MNLTEHQAKHVLRLAGVRVPQGGLVKSAEESEAVVALLNKSNFVVKAQIQAGGRAQGHFKNDSQSRGGIRFVESLAQVKASASQMLNSVLVTEQTGALGELVQSVYIEELVPIKEEKYLALTIDGETGSLIFIASNSGGVGIEALAKQSPELIAKFPVDIMQPRAPTDIADFFGFKNQVAEEFNRLLDTLLFVLIDKDATLIELNPIGLDSQDTLWALDATIIWDDNALFRQGHEEQMIAYEHLSPSEFKAKCEGLNYLEFDGNIGVVSAGAGLAMATLDALNAHGGSPANFLDIPPSSSVETTRQALSLVLENERVSVLFVNIIGGGIMRCDAVSDALLLINKEVGIDIPMVVRLAGSNASLARQRLKASLPEAFVTSDFAAAISAVLDRASSISPAAAVSESPSWWQRLTRVTATDNG